MTKLSEKTRGRRHHFFDDPAMDQLLSMLLATLSELSVTRERLFAMQRLAEEKGLFTREEIEGFQFSEDDENALSEDYNRMIKECFYPLGFDYRPTHKVKSADGTSHRPETEFETQDQSTVLRFGGGSNRMKAAS